MKISPRLMRSTHVDMLAHSDFVFETGWDQPWKALVGNLW